MRIPDVEYIRWAKSAPPVRINLARSGVELCPPSALGLKPADLVVNLPVHDGYAPLVEAIAQRYRVDRRRVFTVSGGTTFATWLAAAAVLNGAPSRSEVLVERPTYEPMVRIPQALGFAVKRFDRRFDEQFQVSLDRFEAAVTSRTRLAMVTNLHNPSGARIPLAVLRRMASILAGVGGFLLVDEVYLECQFTERTESCVHAGPNVLTTSSLTKAYGLDGLRAGWILGPAAVMARAARVNDLFTNNNVAPGDRLALRAFERIGALSARAHRLLDPNLELLRRYFAREARLKALVPEGGNVVFVKLPRGLDGDRVADHLRVRYSTLVVPGRFFEVPGAIRLSYGCRPGRLREGLKNLSSTLDELT